MIIMTPAKRLSPTTHPTERSRCAGGDDEKLLSGYACERADISVPPTIRISTTRIVSGRELSRRQGPFSSSTRGESREVGGSDHQDRARRQLRSVTHLTGLLSSIDGCEPPTAAIPSENRPR